MAARDSDVEQNVGPTPGESARSRRCRLDRTDAADDYVRAIDSFELGFCCGNDEDHRG